MGSLEDRLRALRSAHASKGAAQTRSSGSTSAPQPLCSNDESSALHAGKDATSADAHGNELMSQGKTGDGNEDEIEALIRRTREEVELRRQHGAEVDQDEVEDDEEDDVESCATSRHSAGRSVAAFSGLTNQASGPSWALPEVPMDIFSALPTVPRDPPPDATSEDVHLRHGIDPGRDLSSFSALARLDTKKLSAPGTGPSKGANIRLSKQENEEEEDMEGWCCICNEDASLQCVGCDSDPYCSQCWAEGHGGMDRDELREHKTVPLEPRWKRDKRRAVMS
ncbi:Membrane trafficking and cell signaling protein HRS, contains VHS and FYVE domains [Ceraceosorus bombacis]|uniref:Membrane trafficking and cell signaling protein HRS, contains VHS and FYVE domains n=1 Tax=Ceraceosorus bombacis TaxID=401625 RepID=A0A0P1BHI1_9BASI|nr:Membrane trafficking and cell signaling protein HRS, contains VHS and FYVE domains [Ceraceosorus bombacis]